MKKHLKILLNQLDLIENDAVYFRNEEDGAVFDGFSSDIFKKLQDIQPDAYYVFNKQPFVLFFDLTTATDLKKENELHKKVWSFDHAPIIFVIKDAEVKVYNALHFKKHKGLEEIILSKEERNKRFSFWNLQSGAAFEWFYEKHKKTVLKKRVNQQLFENIKQTILLLKEVYNLEESLAKILVLRLIFIRYLIDRKIKIDVSFIQGHEGNVISRRRSLSELIANPKQLVAFFDYLNKRFNGVLFKDSNIELSVEQSSILSKLFSPDGVAVEDKRNLFSDFDFQFEIFDFGIIPVELISGIYETLLDEETKNATSAVYTPPFLVDYILTETVDTYFEENKSTSACKIFDPAMGSGIFLVQGLRRMIEREKELNPNDDNQTFGEKIKEIAEQNLFGIDINEEAINVACFSIYVALLDYQEPGNIDVYKFPNLKDNNFYKAHFFDLAKAEVWNKIKSENVDFILGNPPWKSNNSPEHIDWLKQTKFDKIVSDKQIAQSYLIRVKDFVKEESKVALIVTSKVYYNNQATNFRKYFLENNILSEIFDLSSVRHLVFEGADNPGAILFFKFKLFKTNICFENDVKHISLKQNKFFNKYSNLYGNTLDYMFLSRFKGNVTIDALFKRNKIRFSKGVFRGTPKKHYTELINLPIIKRKEFTGLLTSFKTDFNRIKYETSFLEAGRTIELFTGKKIILQKSVSVDFKFSIVEFDCVFDSTVYGINFKSNDTLIDVFTSILLSDLYVYYQYLTFNILKLGSLYS